VPTYGCYLLTRGYVGSATDAAAISRTIMVGLWSMITPDLVSNFQTLMDMYKGGEAKLVLQSQSLSVKNTG
jgi:hypothetical protein